MYPQPIVLNNAGTTTAHKMTTAITGFSTTEPIFIVSDTSGGSGGVIHRFLKQKDGSLLMTHKATVTSITANSAMSACVV